MRVIGRSQRLRTPTARRTKPDAIGKKPGGFNIFGAFKRLAGGILGVLKSVVVAAGHLAQKVLDAAMLFPPLKAVLQAPVPLPIFGPVKIQTLLQGVAAVGTITERISNAMVVFERTGNLGDAIKELPIKEVVLFIIAPIMNVLTGVLIIARAGEPERLMEIAKYLEGMFKRIPSPIRTAVLMGIEKKLDLKFPQNIREMITKA